MEETIGLEMETTEQLGPDDVRLLESLDDQRNHHLGAFFSSAIV
jgi:hypothetical protein